MQKALTQMNLQLANVIGDITGLTGMQILIGIPAGERDPHKLAQFRDRPIRASRETIVQSLHGHWREEQLLLILQPEMDSYEKRQLQIAECGQRLQRELAQLPGQESPLPAPELEGKSRRRNPAGESPGQ